MLDESKRETAYRREVIEEKIKEYNLTQNGLARATGLLTKGE